MKLRHTAGKCFIILIIVLLLYLNISTSEGFVDKNRCGVDLPPCSGENVRCINGYCKSDIAPTMPISDLQVIPPKY